MNPGRRVAALTLVLGVLLPVVANADYKDAYKEGVTAVDRKQWSDVVRHMEDAIRQNPQAGGADIRIYGTRMEDYLPYYYLGMGLNEMGRYAEAKAALDKSLSQGAIGNAPKKISRDLIRLIGEVNGKLASMPTTTRDAGQNPRTQGARSEPPRQAAPTGPTPAQQLATARTAAESELSAASDARARVTGMIQQADRLGVFATDPGLRARWDQANQQLGTARSQLDTATTATIADSVKSTAVRLAGEFIQIQAELDRQIQSVERANAAAAQRASDDQSRQIQSRLSSLRNDVSEAERLLSRATEAPHPSLSASRQRLARSISAAKAADAGSSIGVLDSLQSALRGSGADLRTAMATVPAPTPESESIPASGSAGSETPSAGPPPSLRQAAEAFFRGDDDGALRMLTDSRFDDPRAVLQAGLLRAAALHRKFLAGRQSDPSLLEAAREEVAKCRSLDGAFLPDPRYFSPNFVSLYRDSTGP